MNILTILYITAALALGFLLGLTVEVMIDAEQIRKLQKHVDKLKFENEMLIQNKTEVIEIIDNRKQNDESVYHDYFKPF